MKVSTNPVGYDGFNLWHRVIVPSTTFSRYIKAGVFGVPWRYAGGTKEDVMLDTTDPDALSRAMR